MPALPGTNITVSFHKFPGDYPPLFYAANEGAYNLASVNAGNSVSLEVGLGGVNRQFLFDLKAAGQSNAEDLSTHNDDYQDRHLKLLNAVDSSGTASASYQKTDPSVFSYVLANRLSNTTGTYEGVCFVDVFDPKLRPAGNANNVAMVYAAPPDGSNYPVEKDFLDAIETMAANIVKAVAGYNAAAAKQNQPKVQALRNTLFSSGIYNPHGVAADKIARAIFAGFASALKANDAGLMELQFPVSDDPKCLGYPGFAAVQSDLAGAPPQPIAVRAAAHGAAAAAGPALANLARAALAPREAGRGEEDDEKPQEWGEVHTAGDSYDATSRLSYQGGKIDVATLKATISSDTDSLLSTLKGGGALPAGAGFDQIEVWMMSASHATVQAGGGNYGSVSGAGVNYDAATSAIAGFDVVYDAHLPTDNCWDDQQKRKRCYIIAGVATGVAILTALGTALGVLLSQKNGGAVQKLKAKDISTSDLDVDIKAQNDNSSLIDSVKLIQSDGKPGDAAVTVAGEGTWSIVSKTHITLAPSSPPPTQPVSIKYVLEAANAPDAESDPAKLTITIPAAPVKLTAHTLSATANDRTSLVPLPYAIAKGESVKLIHNNAQVDNFVDTYGTWAVDTMNNRITFTPAGTVPSSVAAVMTTYVVVAGGTASDPAAVTVTFPGAPAKPTAKPLTAAANDRSSVVALPYVVNAGEIVKLIQNSAQVDSFADMYGTWTVDGANSRITYTPKAAIRNSIGTLPPAFYVVVAQGVASDPASLTITFPAVSGVVNAANITTHATSLTATVDIDVPGGNNHPASLTSVQLVQNGTPTNGFTDTHGTWAVVASNNHVTFTPGPAFAGETVTSPYVLTAGGTSSQAVLTIDFPQAQQPPQPITKNNASRLDPTDFDIPGANPTIPPGYTVQLIHPLVTVDGEWSVNANSNHVVFSVPPTVPAQMGQYTNEYILIFANGTRSQPATLTITFSTAPVASDFTVRTTDRTVDAELGFTFHSATPAGFKSMTMISGTLSGTSVTVPNEGTWTLVPAQGINPQSVHFKLAAGATQLQYSIQYKVTDINGVDSNLATMTVDYSMMLRMMPRAADFLLAVDPSQTASKLAGVDVLANSSSWFPKKPQSVVLLGLQSIGYQTGVKHALASTNRKSLRVEGEGVWMVDDNGMIAFQGDSTLSHPPTPVVYGFADTQGNLSTPGMIVMDSGVTAVEKFKKKMADDDDKTFWSSFHKNLIDDPSPELTPEEFITLTQSFAEALRMTLGVIGECPVPDADYRHAYAQWVAGGQDWGDLFDACESMVDTALKGRTRPLLARYWRLNLMVKMPLDAY